MNLAVIALCLAVGCSAAWAEPVTVPPVVAICVGGIQSGQVQCYDTVFESPDYIDCTDRPAPPIGHWERGSGFIRWGYVFGGEFVQNGQALYEYSDRNWAPGGVSAQIGVDEDRIFGDGMDRTCQAGRFVP